jgi:transcriptional regulator with XRE-family HTH domain
MQTYAEQIHSWRKLKKLTQKEVAEILGVTQQNYAHQESGALSEKNARVYFEKLEIPFVEIKFKSMVEVLKEQHDFHLAEANKIKRLIELYGGMV